MKKTTVITLISLAIFILLAGCSLMRPVKIGKLKSFKVNEISLNSINLNITLPVENPNFFKINIQKLDLDIKLNNIDLGSVTEINKITIPALSDQEISMNVTLKMNNFMSGTLTVMKAFACKEALISVKGTVYARALMISRSVEINREEQISLNCTHKQ